MKCWLKIWMIKVILMRPQTEMRKTSLETRRWWSRYEVAENLAELCLRSSILCEIELVSNQVYLKLCLHWIHVKHCSPESWEVTLKSASNLKNGATTGDTNIDHQLSLQIILKIGKMAWHPRSKITVQEIELEMELSTPTLISSFLYCSRLLLSMVTQPWLLLLF